ncbi:MAG: hypothetical protein AAFQ80_09340 [Cyanobacteria bacterium J06621_8]
MFKPLIVTLLSAIAVPYFASPALGEDTMAFNPTISRQAPEFSPFHLVIAGYQGQLLREGIPANDAFLSAIRTNQIEAKDLVQSAIASGKLSVDILSNQGYLDSVMLLLNDLEI